MGGETAKPLDVLVISDDEAAFALSIEELRGAGYAPRARRVDSREALAAALDAEWDVVLSDYVLPSIDAAVALGLVRARLPEAPFLIVSPWRGEAAAAALLRAGAADWIAATDRLGAAVEREVREAEARRRLRAAEDARRGEAETAAALARAGVELMSSFGLASLTERSTRILREAVEADVCWTLLREADRQAFVGVASDRAAGDPGSTTAPRVAEAEAAAWFTASPEGEPIELTRAGGAGEAFLAGHGMASALAVPLSLRGEIAAMQIAARRAAPPFSLRHRQVARELGRLASSAIENARLVAEIDRANRLRSEFVATMSHELRTPLTVIIGYNDLLLEGEFGSLSREQSEVIRRSDRSAHELLDLINATLDLSRLDAGRLPLDVQPIDFAVLGESLAAEIARLRQRKPAVDIEWRITPDLPRIKSDPVKLRVVLKNLIGNALHFTERGSVTVRAEPDGDGVELSVADTGVGIAPEELEAMSDPLQQVRRSGGLGLYIVRRLLDAIGADLEIESEHGAGSVFRVRLPAAPPRPATTAG